MLIDVITLSKSKFSSELRHFRQKLFVYLKLLILLKFQINVKGLLNFIIRSILNQVWKKFMEWSKGYIFDILEKKVLILYYRWKNYFRNLPYFYASFYSLEVKRNLISSVINFELPHKFSNDLRLRSLGNQKIKTKSWNSVSTQASVQTPLHNLNFGNSSQK